MRGKKIGVCLFLAMVMMFSGVVYAAPANPFPIETTQADGTRITIRRFGDEFFNWVETLDGDVIAQNSETRNWYYAELRDGAIVPGSDLVGEISVARVARLRREAVLPLAASADRTTGEGFNLPGIQPFSDSYLPRIAHTKNRQPLLVLLIEFNDRRFTEEYAVAAGGINAYWSNHFFGAQESVNAYFREMSGDFDLQFTIPRFNVPQGHYVQNPIPFVHSVYINHGVARVLLNARHPDTTAMGGLVRDDIDWALEAVGPFLRMEDFPITENTILNEDLNIYAIFAGYEGSGTDNRPFVWGHFWARWWLNVDGFQRNFSVDFRMGSQFVLATYGVNGELFATGIPKGIGITVHELAHILGLPDLYSMLDGGIGLAQYCVMSHGSWGARVGEFAGVTPTPINPWGRYRLGFLTPTRVYYSENLLTYIYASINSVYKVVNPALDFRQYFMVENRQLQGFDAGRERWNSFTGILIYHVDERVNFAAVSDGNPFLVNCNNYHRTVAVEGFNGPVWGFQNNPFFTRGVRDGVFDATSTPNSNFHSGGFYPVIDAHINAHPQNLPSGVSIRVESDSSGRMRVQFGEAANEIPRGDVNDDGHITPLDVLLLRLHLAGHNITINPEAADINRDGRISAVDLMLLRMYIAGHPVW